MKTEKISAFVDGELFGAEKQAAAKDLEQPEALARAALYKRIGQELRAQCDMAGISPEFEKKLAARLEAEPPLSAQDAARVEGGQDKPGTAVPGEVAARQHDDAEKPAHALKRFAIPGLVA